MVNNYMEILKGETILAKVADQVGMESYEEVLDTLEVSNPENTETYFCKFRNNRSRIISTNCFFGYFYVY
mgnify:CR=1 FL=1